MQKQWISLLLVFLFQVGAYAEGRLLATSSSSEEDIFRLELQFDRVVDTNKVAIQFQDRNLVLVVPGANSKKALSPITVKPSYIGDVRIADSKDGKVSVELQFNDLQALQMKENLTMESVGNGLIIEVLPPTLNKIENPAGQAVLPVKTMTEKETPVVLAEKPIAEKEIPLFVKEETSTAEGSGMAKIIFMVIAVVAMGGYLLWSMRNRSKMVNGPESLMKIKLLTQFHLGPKKTLAVVRVAGESMLLGITDSQISLIKTLALLDEDLPEVTAGTFAAALDKQDQPTRETSLASELENAVEEEFSFGPAVKTSLSQKIPMLRKII